MNLHILEIVVLLNNRYLKCKKGYTFFASLSNEFTPRPDVTFPCRSNIGRQQYKESPSKAGSRPSLAGLMSPYKCLPTASIPEPTIKMILLKSKHKPRNHKTLLGKKNKGQFYIRIKACALPDGKLNYDMSR